MYKTGPDVIYAIPMSELRWERNATRSPFQLFRAPSYLEHVSEDSKACHIKGGVQFTLFCCPLPQADVSLCQVGLHEHLKDESPHYVPGQFSTGQLNYNCCTTEQFYFNSFTFSSHLVHLILSFVCLPLLLT